MMPTTDEILSGLGSIAQTWTTVAVFWHVYFATIIGFLVSGAKPSRRIIALLMAPPLLSVSILAWLSGNPVNGSLFALIAGLVLVIGARMPRESVRPAQPQILITGVIFFGLGWIYPYFLDTRSLSTYAFAAPIGLLPSPTLLIVTGLCLVLNALDSFPLAIVLGLAGLLYGAFGSFTLGIAIDALLFFAGLSILLQGAALKQR